MTPGDALWLFDYESGCSHVHVVLTYPEPDPKTGRLRVAVVNLTTIHGLRYDPTTVLSGSDHPDLGEELRYVLYSDADFEDVEHLEIELREGRAKALAPFSPSVFERICDGLFTTEFDPPNDVLDYCFARMPGDGTVRKLT